MVHTPFTMAMNPECRVGSDDNDEWMTAGSKFTRSGLMLLGRLELFVVLALLTPRFWTRS